MSDDLVKRLRKADEYEPLGHDGWEAADRIEELEAKLAKAHLALNYFLLRDPDKPLSWEYTRDRAEHLARTTLAELTGDKEDDK